MTITFFKALGSRSFPPRMWKSSLADARDASSRSTIRAETVASPSPQVLPTDIWAIADRLKEKILYGSPVTRIEHDKSASLEIEPSITRLQGIS